MNKIEITRDEFDSALHEVTEEIIKSDEIEGMMKLVVPMVGMMFAKKIEDKLFGDNSDSVETDKT